MTVRVESATVYRGGGRRWFTKRAAFRAEARAMIKKRCECERGDAGDPYGMTGFACAYHEDQQAFARLVTRLARFMAIRAHRSISSSIPDPTQERE